MNNAALKMSQEFQKTAGFEQEQAEAIAEAIYKSREDLATKKDLDRFATKQDLDRFATKQDLERFATKEDLERFATKEDLEKYATKEDLETGLRLLKAEQDTEFEKVRTEIAKSQNTSMYAALAVILVVLAINADFSNWFGRGASVATPASAAELLAMPASAEVDFEPSYINHYGNYISMYARGGSQV